MALKSIHDFAKHKSDGEKIAMVTCYDCTMARIVAEADTDTILVGDSLGNAVAGYNSTIPVTLEQMIYHAEMVRRGAPETFMVVDLPFMAYHVSIEKTLENCGRIMKETGANAVKLEGGRDFEETIRALTRASIPVMGHLGLTPQSVHRLGGYSVQGREEEKAMIMREDARILEDAGVFSLVLEMVPEKLAADITESLKIPTIGIGAGRHTDGQVLVITDLLGYDATFNPKFLKKFANIHATALGALQEYKREVREGAFPAKTNVFS